VTSLPAKTCTQCGAEKPLTDYPKRAASADGYTSECRVCNNASNAKYRAKNRDPELVAKRQRLEEEAAAGLKTCTQCGELKLLTEYYKRAASVDGLKPTCKSCSFTWAKTYYEVNSDLKKEYDKKYYEENKESIAAAAKKYYEKNKEALIAYKKDYHQKNKEAYNERSRMRYQENKEALKPYKSEYAKNNRAMYNEAKRRRRARMLGNGVEVYTELQVLETYGTDCHICNRPVDMSAPRRSGDPGWETGLHIDHVIPISRGGQDSLANVRPSHGVCNLKKHANLGREF
jgi:5-methylcytosine-specific restriction endonuclease McrA